jgi:hypothetical protein
MTIQKKRQWIATHSANFVAQKKATGKTLPPFL